MFYPVIPLAESKAVGAASVAFALVLAPNRSYLVTTNGNCWIKQGVAPTAAAGAAGNFYVAASAEPIVVRGDHGINLAVIQDGAATGFCTITPAQE